MDSKAEAMSLLLLLQIDLMLLTPLSEDLEDSIDKSILEFLMRSEDWKFSEFILKI